jgi:hypothetical protein
MKESHIIACLANFHRLAALPFDPKEAQRTMTPESRKCLVDLIQGGYLVPK